MILGVIILWVGWMGFNPGSFLNAIGVNFADVAVNTNLAAAAGVIGATVGALLHLQDARRHRRWATVRSRPWWPSPHHVPSWTRGPPSSSASSPASSSRRWCVLVDKLKIDDPVGALPVHGMAGIWGTLAVRSVRHRRTRGLPRAWARAASSTGGGGHQLWVQFYGVIATIGFTFTCSLIVFAAIKYTIGLRVSEDDELRGLDISEHGMFGYPERFIDVPGAESGGRSRFPPAPAPAGAASATSPATAS